MFKEPELKPDQELTPIQHPKQSLGPVAGRLRVVLMAIVVIGAAVMLYMLRQEGVQQQQAIAAAKAEAEKARAVKNATLLKTIPAWGKGESQNATQRALVLRVGQAIAQKTAAKNVGAKWNFHLLAEENAINLYALSSGDVYVTTALVNRMKTEGQLAAALAHGVAHTIGHDVPELLANATDKNPQWNYTLEAEQAADKLALQLMAQAGYDPNAMIGMFSVFADGYTKGAEVSFFVTHPNDQDRMNRVQQMINAMYPKGIPAELSK